MYNNDKVIRRYSEPFNLKIITMHSDVGNRSKIDFIFKLNINALECH